MLNAGCSSLSTSCFVSKIVKDGSNSTVSLFKEIAGLVLEILDAANGAKSNKEHFQRLAEDSCGLVCAILYTYQDKNLLTQDWDNIRNLSETLTSIVKFTRKESSPGFLQRMVRNKYDRKKIQQYRNHLQQFFCLFGFETYSGIHETMARIIKQEQDLRASNKSTEAVRCDPSMSLTTSAPSNYPSQQQPSSSSTIIINIGQIMTDASRHITNTNSGNITTTSTNNSNNDSSARVYGSWLN